MRGREEQEDEREGGLPLRPGMIFTIEPMINLGRSEVALLSDGWTVGGVVLALLAIRLLLLAASAAAVMLLSRRCAMVPALLLSLLLLLLPVGAAYAWM